MVTGPMAIIPSAVHLSEMEDISPKAGVYFLWHGNSVVYVGQAKIVSRRIVDHMVEAVKVFDGLSYILCSPKNLNQQERFFIEMLLPKYNRCSFSEAVRRTWVGHMESRPISDKTVRSSVAAEILGVAEKQLRILHDCGLAHRRIRIPRCNARRTVYSFRDILQFTAQNAEAIKAVKA